ncbi:MAG: hypothetical protein V1847_01865 [Candidatus Diapherotrites archaeon]
MAGNILQKVMTEANIGIYQGNFLEGLGQRARARGWIWIAEKLEARAQHKYENANARLRLAYAGERLKGSLHEHFVPFKSDKRTEAQAERFWKRIERLKFDFVAVTTHAGAVGKLQPENIFELLERKMPETLKQSKFLLIPAIEFTTAEGIDVIALSGDKKALFDRALLSKKWTLNGLLDELRNRKCAGFLPHPSSMHGAQFQLSELYRRKRILEPEKAAARELARLVQAYGLGVEAFHGMSAAHAKVVSWVPFPKLRARWLSKVNPVPSKELRDQARFLTAGTDAHDVKNLGMTFFEIPRQRGAVGLEEFLNSLPPKIALSHSSKKALTGSLRNIRGGTRELTYYPPEAQKKRGLWKALRHK